MSEQVPAGGVDPARLPDGHPLKVLGTQLGVVSPHQGPLAGSGDAVGPPRHASNPQPNPQIIQGNEPRQSDPFSRPYVLPSGGLAYGPHDGTVLISPMRGEQEVLVAGAGSGLSATPTLRHVISQCVDTRSIDYEDLTLEDWSAVMLHVMALSMGTDNLPLFPVCDHCNTQFDGSRPLSSVPCRVLRRAASGEETSWPPETTQDEDEDLRILREMGLAESSNETHQVFVCSSLDEPVEVTLSDGQRIGWRYLRLRDLVQAEDFAERSGGVTDVSPGAKLNTFIQARFIETIGGKRVGVLEAMKWVKQTVMPLRMEFSAMQERRSFGYELSPMFRCPNGHRFRQELPLNAAMFRRRLRASLR